MSVTLKDDWKLFILWSEESQGRHFIGMSYKKGYLLVMAEFAQKKMIQGDVAFTTLRSKWQFNKWDNIIFIDPTYN